MKKFLFLITLLTIFIGGTNSVKADGTKTPIKLTGATNSPTIVPIAPSTLDNLYAATFTPTADFSNIFQYQNFAIGNYDKIVIEFGGENGVQGDWHINLPDGNFPTIEAGTKKYEISLEGVTNYADFTIFNWGSERTPITITAVYFEKGPDAPFISTEGGFGEEITSLEEITDGTRFVIGDGGTNVLYWVTSSVDNQKADVKSVPNDSYYYYTLENVAGLDLDNNGEEDTDNYRIKIINSSGSAFTHAWNLGSYLNYSMWGHLFAGSGKSTAEGGTHNYGGDDDYYAIWKVVYSDGNGFYLKNAGINRYAKVTGTSESIVYLKFYKSIEFTNTTMYPANDEIFALSKATGYDDESGEMTNGTWTFDTPVDLSNWKYLIMALAKSSADGSHEIAITDNNGITVKGEDYVGEDAGTGPNMWFSYWNNQIIACININYLKDVKGMDITAIKSLSVSGTIKPTVAYLSSYDSPKLLTTNRWALYKEGDVKREYTNAQLPKFGTICLPYKASYAGAEVYSIASRDGITITLTKVNGLLEAGKPYLYTACDEVGEDAGANEKDVHNVNFYRADFDRYDVATPVTNNGLIGTFSNTTAPQGENIWILSNNKLYDTVGSTVSVGANKAYIDIDQITNNTNAKARAIINFGEGTTNINKVDEDDAVKALNSGKIYDLSGREVARPSRGFYIIGKKKVWIK